MCATLKRLAIGFAIVAFVLGVMAAISIATAQSRYMGPSGPMYNPDYYVPGPDGRLMMTRPPQVYYNTPGYAGSYAPGSPSYFPQTSYASPVQPQTCREASSFGTIGGQTVELVRIVCLQADGSWK